MRANILLHELPHTVRVHGMEYGINYDFRTSILFDLTMRSPELSAEEKIYCALQLYYPGGRPKDINAAMDAVLDFYNCGKSVRPPEKEEPRNQTRQRFKKEKAVYSFAEDAPYIYAAFREQYGIDLQAIRREELHWWEFMALFESLSEQTKFSKIMYYRSVSTSGMSKEQRRHINEMKKLYALEDESTCNEKTALAKRDAQMRAYVMARTAEVKMNSR